MSIDEIFEKFINGTDNDKAEVREFIRRHENLHLLHSPEFVRRCVENAAAFGVVKERKPNKAAKLQKINAQIVALEERVHQLRMHAAQLKKEN